MWNEYYSLKANQCIIPDRKPRRKKPDPKPLPRTPKVEIQAMLADQKSRALAYARKVGTPEAWAKYEDLKAMI